MSATAPTEPSGVLRGTTRAVLFDLDGTFADTAPDLGYALNVLLAARGKSPLPLGRVRQVASSGARGLLGLGFDLAPGDPGYDALATEFLDLYERRLCRDTRLFPGIPELLQVLEERSVPWGIVTNKAERFTFPLMRLLELDRRAACVVCGDSTPYRKPHPQPLLTAAATIGVAPAACIYLGDDERDMIAGRAAGMRVAVAEYGYLGTGNPPQRWAADMRVRHPLELLASLE
ncbi:MAG: HAD family hydrolase [Betaproteobacteria bacterium]|nr:MAG: HAD family hydrolase [Betaproteobacteria bacterium]